MREINEVFINGVCLEEILDKHKRWVKKEEGGERAELINADLSNVNLSDTNLTGADLTNANLSGANLIWSILKDCVLNYTYLRYANLSRTDLSYADLTNADLSNTDLSFACLICANLRCVDLKNAYLYSINLKGANLYGANLQYANLNNVKYSISTAFFALQCPEEGSFIGYKKADNKIVKLLITEDAKRSSGTSRKCRCSKAKVLSITNIENVVKYNKVTSDYDKSFVYKVGEIVEVKDFDEDRWNECSTGIHFFLTRDEAVNY